MDGVAAMNRRRIIRPLGVAAGGLGAAFLPVAVAFADDYTFVPEPGTEQVTGIFGLLTAPPAVGGSVQETQVFDFHDLITNGTGTVNADANIFMDPFGDSNQELLITPGDTTGTDVPPVGSVFDTFTLGFDTGLQNVYSDIPGAGVSDTLVSPFGDISIPFPFYDAAVVPGSDVGNTALEHYYDIFPVSGSETTSAITGDPPLDFAVQGSQSFLDTAAGGTFPAATFNTSDLFANTSEAILVTGPGSAAGDPPVGSVFNVINIFGNDTGFQDIYSAIPTANGDVVSDSLVTPFGNIPIPITFDAAAVHPVDVPLAGGYDAMPVGTETLTGVGGVPPLDVVIQGNQTFDVDATGGAPESFGADVSTASTPFGINDEALLVTSDTPGAAAGDLPPVGSEFNIFTFGNSGFENIIADLTPSTSGGADVVSDTLVTPFGDYTIPLSELVTNLPFGSLLDGVLAGLF
jgi:hypothetical protein